MNQIKLRWLVLYEPKNWRFIEKESVHYSYRSDVGSQYSIVNTELLFGGEIYAGDLNSCTSSLHIHI